MFNSFMFDLFYFINVCKVKSLFLVVNYMFSTILMLQLISE